MARREKFYRNLNLGRCLLMSSPFLLAATASQGLDAATFNATDVASLRAAIASANSSGTADTINVAAGTYLLNTSGSGPLVITKPENLDIIGAGAGTTIIDAANASRLLQIDTGAATNTITIQGLTLQNGYTQDNGTTTAEARGGAILYERSGAGAPLSTVAITNATIQNCAAEGTSGASGSPGQAGFDGFGGAIWMEGGTLNITGCTFDSNSALGGSGGAGSASGARGGAGGTGNGGAIYVNAGVVAVSGSTFVDNSAIGGSGGAGSSSFSGAGGNGGDGGAAFGGAIYVNSGTMQISGSTDFTTNLAEGGQGGDGGDGGAPTSGAGRAGGDGGSGGAAAGGAVYSMNGTHTISGGTFSQNQALGGDGALYAGWGGDASTGGGGDGGRGGDGGLAQGGGLFANGGSFTIDGAVLDQNTAQGGDAGTGVYGGSGYSGPGGAGGFGGDGGAGQGGGVFADAGSTVQISTSTISGNSAIGGIGESGGSAGSGDTHRGGPGGAGGAGGSAVGGGVYVDNGSASMTLDACTLSGNQAVAGNGGAGGDGGLGSSVAGRDGGNGGPGGVGGNALGGGYYRLGGTPNLVISNCTISGNSVSAGNGGDGGGGGYGSGFTGVSGTGGNGGDGGNTGQAQGAGIYIGGGTTSISNSTVAGNTATAATVAGAAGSAGSGDNLSGVPGLAGVVQASAGGGIVRSGGSVSVTSSILADNTADANPDAEGTYAANNSLIENGVAPSSGSSNIQGSDPGLSGLANNGGPTQTQAIGAGSAALNAGSNPLSLATDQRGTGFPRDDGSGVDMGAFEYQSGAVTPPTVTDPASALATNAANYNIQGTAPQAALVRVYVDVNQNGTYESGTDTLENSQQLGAGVSAYSVQAGLQSNQDNYFVVTAEVGSVESTGTAVPTITQDSIAPNDPVITDPTAGGVNTTGTTYNIVGTAEAGSTVDIYSDFNDNGVVDGADGIVGTGTATGGNFSISVPITQSTTNNFTARATDAAGNASGQVDVPTITETTVPAIPAPTITDPTGPISIQAANYTIMGTAQADSLVRIYIDVNNNGIVDLPGDTVAASQQLTGGATAFAISTPLTAGTANNFVATADDGAGNESLGADVPTITETTSGGGGSGGGGDGGGGGCSTGGGSGLNWLLFGSLAAAAFSLFRNLFTRKRA